MARSRIREIQIEDSDIITEAEMSTISGSLQTQIDGKSDTGHDHDSAYYTETELDAGQLDNRYYTESEVDSAISTFSGTIDHNTINNTHNLTTDIDHNQLTNFESNEHFTEASIDKYTQTEVNTISGALSTEIDLDITTHAAISSAHHAKYTNEEAQDAVGGVMSGAGSVTVTYDDTANTITVSGTAGGASNHDELNNLDYASAGHTGFAQSTHDHDGDTLQLDGINSDGGAFPFTTSGTVSFNQGILTDSYIGIGTDTVPHAGVGSAKLAIEGTNSSVDGPHVQFTTDSADYPLLQILPYAQDSIHLCFDSYFDGAWKSSDSQSSFWISKLSNTLKFQYGIGVAGASVSQNQGFIMSNAGVVSFFQDVRIAGDLGITADPDLIQMADGTLTINGTLGLLAGTTINEFSTDTTLSGNSDNAVPTEKAVKAYVDAIGTGNYVPVGSIITSASGVPFGYLECDGSSKSTSTYPDLFEVIGYMYGGSGGSFNIPDYRGEFLRGFAHGDATDPDRAGRTDRGDGTTGDAVGTKQADEFESHAHTATQRASNDGAGNAYATVGSTAIGPGSISLADSGGNETRPTNIYVIYCIRYFKGNDAEVDLDHGGLRGLADDDHPQYGGIATTETISGSWTFNPNGTGVITDYDISVGDTDGSPTYGIVRIGDSIIGRTSYNVASLDLDGSFLVRNVGTPPTSNIEYLFADSSNTIRFALAKPGVGNATYSPRSMLIAGPAVLDDTIVTVGYWQSQGIFDNLVCDTTGSGADLGVQNDLEVEGNIFVDSILESTTSSGVSIDGAVIKDGSILLSTGTTINEFSIDTTLAGNSDDAVPTEKAVKVYVDTAVSGAGGGLFTEDVNNNIVGGDNAGSELSSGSDNFFGGDAAGRYGDGSRNIGIGTQALEGTTSQTVNDNIGIGYQVGTAFTTADNNVLIGSYAGYTLATGDNNVMIGYEAGYENVKLRNTFIGHTAGRNLDGNNSYETVAIGYQALLGNTSASDSYGSVAIGANALKSNQSSWYVVAIGFDAAQALTTPNGSVFIGYQAGYSATTLAASIMIGYKAGYFNDDGSYSIVIGYEAGYGVTGNDYDRCILMGYRSGYKLINTGDDNILIGHQAGFDMTTANGTVAIGSYAGYENTIGDKCTYVGYEAGRYNDSDSRENTGIGYQSLQGTTGNQCQYNTAVGVSTGLALTIGDRNVLVGHSAGVGLTTGGSHVFLGILAGASQSTATGSIYIGRQAGYYGNGSYNIGIGYYALEGTTGQDNSNNIGIGYQVGIGMTTAEGAIMIGYKAASNAAFDADYAVIVGYEAGYNWTTGVYSILIGYRAGYNNATGGSNICIGAQAGYGAVSNNPAGMIAIGNYALMDIETAGNCIAIGNNSMTDLTSGGQNLAIGYMTLFRITTGANNVAIGYQSGQGGVAGNFGNCTLVGFQTGYKLTTNGNNNVFVGYQAGYNGTSAAGNVYIGYQAGLQNTTGYWNVVIGHENTGTAGQAWSENVIIGYRACKNIGTGSKKNVVMGYQAGLSFAAGTACLGNVLLGFQAGDNITSGDYNISIGYDIDPLSATNSNQFSLGTGTYSFLRGDMANYQLGIYGANGYLNFNTTLGSTGYGFRDASGAMEYKDSGGGWLSFTSVSGSLQQQISDHTHPGGGGLFSEDGNDNIVGGTGADGSFTSASNNFLGGVNAGAELTSGSNNVYIGKDAGRYGVASTYNIGIGTQALEGTTAQNHSNCIGIGYQTGLILWTGDNNILIGYQSGIELRFQGSNVYVGSFAGRYGDGTSNVGLGHQALEGTTSNNNSRNVGIGYQVGLALTTGYDNVFVGYQAGISDTTGASNVFMGYHAGYYAQSGPYNIMIGKEAGKGTSTYACSNDIIIGYQAGYSISTGTNNVLMGHQCAYFLQTGGSNVVLGSAAGQGASGQNYSNNVLVGASAGFAVTTGGNNVIMGYQAGYSATDGTGNVFIGYQAGYSETGSNKLYIDSSNTATPLIYGDFNTDVLTINGKLVVEKDTGGTYDSTTVAAVFGDSSADAWDSTYIIGNTINAGLTRNVAMGLLLNYRGYNGGTTQFRNLTVADGKAATVAEFNGQNKTLQLGGIGTPINEFSLDGTLAGNSDNALPSEKAVKTYVDGQVAGESVPVSTIIATASGTPNGYLECDGSSISTTTYSDLFAVIGYMYGGAGASFNIPDYRGEFLRGFANGDATDPDRAARTDRGDGTTGDAVGTKQVDGFKSHTHKVGSSDTPVAGGATDRVPGSSTINSGGTGGNETRPTNVYVIYCIKY